MRDLIGFGIILILVGFVLITISIISEIIKRRDNAKVEGGGVIFIGPIPIIFGTNSKMAYFSAIIAILILIYVIISMRL